MIKIKEERFLHTYNLHEFKLENNDTILLTHKLIVKDHGNIIQEECFIDFASLKQWLVNNSFDLFNWIQDNEPEIELPDFEHDETIQNLKTTLKNYDYNWWTVYIIID